MPEWKTKAAQKMRRFPTESERILWERLRKKQVGGARFRQQAPLYGYIADFYCPALNLVVEVDGSFHDDREESDAQRDYHLRLKGISVLRFSADAVVNDIDDVVSTIAGAVEARRGAV